MKSPSPTAWEWIAAGLLAVGLSIIGTAVYLGVFWLVMTAATP